MNPLFLADSFVKSFGPRDVLKSATAWATPGRVTAILGRNGCGKTTLLRLALGLGSADQGQVFFDGTVRRRPYLWKLAAEGLFFLPDHGLLARRIQFGQQLELLERRYGVSSPADVAQRLGVDPHFQSVADEMSGGERRRAELALALARRPRCLIADEPLAGVEPKERRRVSESLRAEAAEGMAILVTGHDVDDLMALADDVIWMVAGTTHGLGSPAEAQAHHQFRREYLGE